MFEQQSSYVPPVAEIDDGADPELLSIFLEEAEEVLTAADDELNNWRANLEDKRILFLADRNILANQAYNAFSAFPEDALVRIEPKDIRKKGKVPKNGNLFFTIFQTFMSGTDENGQPAAYFGEYPSDFFDLIVIDECHRGGANDEGNWRGWRLAKQLLMVV